MLYGKGGGGLHKSLLDLLHPIGEYYETSNTSFDPNVSWGGTWVKETDERVLVAAGSSIAVGATGGEKTHTLSVNEMARHRHSGLRWGTSEDEPITLNEGSGKGYNVSYKGGNSYQYNSITTALEGGGEAHNNMQPYKGVVRWHRTA